MIPERHTGQQLGEIMGVAGEEIPFVTPAFWNPAPVSVIPLCHNALGSGVRAVRDVPDMASAVICFTTEESTERF